MHLPSLKLSLLFIDVCEAGEVTKKEPDRVPTGVFVFRGSPIDIDALTISLDDQGNVSHSGGGLRSGLEIWPLWMRIAIDHESTAVVARSNILDRWADANGEQQGELLQAETRDCLVSMSASAFGLESMAISAAKRAGLPPTIGQRASSARRIAEVLKQCFVMTERQFLAWRSSAIQIFDARNEAVHPAAGSTAPLAHPAISTLVPRPVHVFRVENASATITTALSMAQLASSSPKERLGRQFREGVSSWAEFVRDLRDRRGSTADGS